MHLVQALILLPKDKRTHWRLGYFLFVPVGLYLVCRSFLRVTAFIDFLPQIEHLLAIIELIYHIN